MSKEAKKKGATHTRQIGKYQIGQLIGKGASGTVYKALDVETATFVALKEIPTTNEQEIESIRSEIQLLKSLRHPNIVKYIEAINTKENLIIITEYVENGSLSNVVKKFGNLQESLVQIYVFQVCLLVFIDYISLRLLMD